MKSIINRWFVGLMLGLSAFQISCTEGNLAESGEWKTGLYFQKDSITFSFGVTPLEITEYKLKVPLTVMGNISSNSRSFNLKIDDEKTTAVKSLHFEIAESNVVEADSVNGYAELIIYRNRLDDSENYRVGLTLLENENFIPVNENFKNIVIYFNNRVDPPDWKDWQGKQTWPSFKLGAWNPLTYIKFIELFREMKYSVPSTYNSMVAEFGEDLKNVTYGWAWDYDKSLTKYVLIPLYQYFMEEHTDLGVIIPRPTGY